MLWNIGKKERVRPVAMLKIDFELTFELMLIN